MKRWGQSCKKQGAEVGRIAKKCAKSGTKGHKSEGHRVIRSDESHGGNPPEADKLWGRWVAPSMILRTCSRVPKSRDGRVGFGKLVGSISGVLRAILAGSGG